MATIDPLQQLSAAVVVAAGASTPIVDLPYERAADVLVFEIEGAGAGTYQVWGQDAPFVSDVSKATLHQSGAIAAPPVASQAVSVEVRAKGCSHYCLIVSSTPGGTVNTYVRQIRRTG